VVSDQVTFYGYHFAFDGIPCEEHEVMIFDWGGPKDEGGYFAATGEIIEDQLLTQMKPMFYGVEPSEPLEFKFTFGASPCRVNIHKPLDRWDMQAIASWLTNKDGYRWLEIEQPDMEVIRYKCVISELKYLTSGWLPWAFECTVRCDSGCAYTFPEWFSYLIHGTQGSY
jgi:hypothetical protein